MIISVWGVLFPKFKKNCEAAPAGLVERDAAARVSGLSLMGEFPSEVEL